MNLSRLGLLLGFLFVALPRSAVATDAPALQELMTMRVEGDITIDSAGRVLEYHIDTPLQAELKQVIDRAVPGWLFHPVTVDGQAVRAKTGMQITLTAERHGQGYRIAIDKALFRDDSIGGAPAEPGFKLSLKDMKPLPRFPSYTVDGLVVVYVRFSPEGRVEEAMASQATLFNAAGEPEVLARALREMEENAVTAIRQWTADVVIHEGTDASDITATIPVAYIWGAGKPKRSGLFGATPRPQASAVPDNLGQWRLERRGAQRAIPWLPDARLAQAGVSDIDPAAPLLQPATSSFRLRDTSPEAPGASRAL